MKPKVFCKRCQHGTWGGCNRDETYNTFTGILEGWQGRQANKHGDCEYYIRKRWKLWPAKVLITLALILGGCSSKMYHRQTFDPQGNLLESVKITLADCIMHSEAEQIYVEFDGKKRKLIIGKFTQWPDPATVQAIAVGFRPWWIGLWGL